jgi:hypothetical protein
MAARAEYPNGEKRGAGDWELALSRVAKANPFLYVAPILRLALRSDLGTRHGDPVRAMDVAKRNEDIFCRRLPP